MADISSPNDYHLIHANVAVARAPLDDPIMADFILQADQIDELAQSAPGFVAQPTPKDEGFIYTGRSLLNLSTWETVENLEHFTHRGAHALALERRQEWFEPYEGPNYVLYWAPVGHIPTEEEVKERLNHLARFGPTPDAFTFSERFTVEDVLAEGGRG